MDLSGKGFSPAHSFLQNASSLVSAYGLGSSLVTGQTPLTTSFFSGTSHGLTSPVYSGSLSSSLSPSHTSFSNGHHISLHRHSEKQDGSAKSQIYASPAPVFNRHKDSFPYGISGVPMPNYNYHGDVYQFTSNGYPRKSRTCSYCGKVFTRSTTRRYHEKRCPLLRAAVSSYMGDENSGTATAAVSSTQSRGRSVELTTHSYKGPGQSIGSSVSGINLSSKPQELATSMLAKSPAGERRASGESLLSGYQTSVIVKQEPHELEALANMASGASSSTLNKQHLVESQDMSESMLCYSPGSDDSDYRIEKSANVSPGYEPGLDLSVPKSPSHTSSRSENIRRQYGNKIDNGSEVGQDGGVMPPHLAPLHRERFNADLNEKGKDENDRGVMPPHLAPLRKRYAKSEEQNVVEDDENAGESNEMFDSNGELLNKRRRSAHDAEGGETESVTSDKRDGKTYSSHKCGICGKTFENAGKLHLHEQLHTKFKPYACKFCGQKFAKAAQRVEHEKTHNGTEVTHVCAVCGSSFTRKYSLKLHMRRWHQEGPWLCRHCGKASLTQMELKTHLYSHNLPKLERESLLYMPDIPHNYAATSANSEDTDGKDYGSKQSAENEGATGQEISLQSMQEMEMCQECGRDFPKGYLRYHLKSHEAQKPYSCPICAKRFGYKNNMKSHIKLHTGIKPFQCKICGAKFTRGSTLRRHARRHGIIADSVWDLFVKPNYSKNGENQTRNNKLNTLSTSRMDSNLSAGNQTSTGSGAGDSGESNYLVNTLSSTPKHGSLYQLYPSLGQIPPHLSLYSGLSASTSYLAPQLPHSSIYAASSQRHPQQSDALNLSVNKGPNDQQSDQSSFSNVSAEGSRSRSRSLSGSETRRFMQGEEVKMDVKDVGVQVNTCCTHEVSLKSAKSDESLTALKSEIPVAGSSVSSATPTPQLPNSPSPMAVVPYIVTSPSQRPSDIDSTSPALSVSSAKDYSMETISSLIGSGRMFKCFHCECYFAEYAMYRIHSKLHVSDSTHPFVCMVCGEDCHDRVYFALHLAEHLRLFGQIK